MLANTLFENHGLTLQQHKTYIQSAARFLAANAESDTDQERLRLTQNFQSILSSLGIVSLYEPILYENLTNDAEATIDALNLTEILSEQINSDKAMDVPLTGFLLRPNRITVDVVWPVLAAGAQSHSSSSSA